MVVFGVVLQSRSGLSAELTDPLTLDPSLTLIVIVASLLFSAVGDYRLPTGGDYSDTRYERTLRVVGFRAVAAPCPAPC
jgi:hypothetical protein